MQIKNDFNKIILSLFSRFSYQIFSMIIIFFMTPFMIKNMGDYKYGIWMIATILVNYLGLVEFGITSAVQRNLAVAYGEKNKSEFNVNFNNGLLLNIIIFFIIVILSIIAYIVINYIHIKDYKLISLIVLIMGVNFAQTFPFKTFSSVINAYIRFDLISIVMLIQLLLTNAATVFAVNNGCNLVKIAIYTLISTFLSNLFYVFFAKKISDYFSLNLKLINKTTIKQLLNYSKKTVLIQISALFKLRMDEVVIATFISVSQVATYSVASRLIGCVNSVGGLFAGVLNPLISKNHKVATDEQKIKLFYFTSKTIIVMFSMILFGIIYLGHPFIHIWIGAKYSIAYYSLVILGVYSFLMFINGIGTQYMYASGNHHYLGYIGLIEGILNLLCSIAFVKYFNLGITGVALGSLIPGLIFKLIIQPILTSKELKCGLFDYYKFLTKSISIGTALYLPLGLLIFKFTPTNYLTIALWISGFVCLAIVHILLLLNNDEKNFLKKKFSRIFSDKISNKA